MRKLKACGAGLALDRLIVTRRPGSGDTDHQQHNQRFEWLVGGAHSSGRAAGGVRHGSKTQDGLLRNRAQEAVLHPFAGFEARNAFGRRLDCLTGAGVWSFPRLAGLRPKCAEPAQFDATFLGELIDDRGGRSTSIAISAKKATAARSRFSRLGVCFLLIRPSSVETKL